MQAGRDRLEVAAGQSAVRREALEHDAARLQPVEELLVLADGDEPADVGDRVLLRAHEDGIRLDDHLLTISVERRLRVALLALLDEPGVLGEARDVEHELLPVVVGEL